MGRTMPVVKGERLCAQGDSPPVQLSNNVMEKVVSMHSKKGVKKNTRDWYLFHLCGFTIPLNLFQMLRKIEKYLDLSIIIPIFAA